MVVVVVVGPIMRSTEKIKIDVHLLLMARIYCSIGARSNTSSSHRLGSNSSTNSSGRSTEVGGYDEDQKSGFDLKTEGRMTRNLLDESFDRDFYLQGNGVRKEGRKEYGDALFVSD